MHLYLTFLSLMFQSSILLTAHFTLFNVLPLHSSSKIITTFLETGCKEMIEQVKLEDWVGKPRDDDRRRKWIK